MNTGGQRTWHDIVIENGIAALLVFAPLAFASVQVWASAILQIAAYAIFAVWLHRVAQREAIVLEVGSVMVLLSLFVALVLFQLLPLPPSLLSLFSPATITASSGQSAEAAGWHPISIHPQATLAELLRLLAYLALFSVIVHHYRAKPDILRLVRTIIITGCVLVAIALLQKAFWNGRLYWFYPLDPALLPRLNYIWGPYINRNHFAGYLEIAAPLALGYSFYGMTRLKQAHAPGFTLKDLAILGHQGIFKIVLPFIAFVLLSGILFATFSRGAILAYLVSMMLFFIMMRKRRSLRSMTALLVIVMVIVLMVGLVAAWERIEDRFAALRYEERLSRAWVWADLVPLVRDFPIFGTGLGTFDRAFLRYQTKYSMNTFEHAENEYLEVLTDTGFAGFLLFGTAGAAFCVMLIRMWRSRRSAFAVCMGAGGLASFAAMAAHGMTDFNLRVPANALLMTVVLGLTFAALRRPDDGDRNRTCSGADDRSRRTGAV